MSYKGRHRRSGRYVPQHSAGNDPILELIPPQASVLLPTAMALAYFSTPAIVTSSGVPPHLDHRIPLVVEDRKFDNVDAKSKADVKPTKKKKTVIPPKPPTPNRTWVKGGKKITMRVAEPRSAQQILASCIKRWPILKGTTVEYGDARGYQAIAYYKSGRIVIDRNHTASLETIMAHEVKHIIDWRRDGDIDRPD